MSLFLVVDHVVRSEADITVQVGGRLAHRQPELFHQIAAVHSPLPKQSKLDELEALRDSPTKLRLFTIHFALPSLHTHENYARTIIGFTLR